ncbi:hypothetical protein ACOJBO_01380 [Rhizobium beringeri]
MPDDPLAATDQLAARWKEQDATRLQRGTLAPDVDDAKAECVALETVDDEARAAVAALAASASVANDDDALLGIATRCAARARLLQEKDQVERSIADVSDGLGISGVAHSVGWPRSRYFAWRSGRCKRTIGAVGK